MGRGKINKTIPLKKKVDASWTWTVNSSPTARNLSKNELGAVIFGCKYHTFAECLKKKIFGLPAAHYSYVKNVMPGLALFLFNYSDRKLHGIFEAVSCGQMNMDQHAWATCEGADFTPYAAQVRMDSRTKCRPLYEDEFKPIIEKNYYTEWLFWFELDKEQTRGLIQLFLSSPLPEKMPRPPKAAKQVNTFDVLSSSDVNVAADEEFENLDSWSYPGAEMKLNEKESSYASVLVTTHASAPPEKKWSELFRASSSSHNETSKPPPEAWLDAADVESDSQVVDNWEKHALVDHDPQEAYENVDSHLQFHELDSEKRDLWGVPSSDNVIFSDREGCESETTDSQIQSDSTDGARLENCNALSGGGVLTETQSSDFESVIFKMTQEVEGLKFNQLKQRLKMDCLEQELVHSKLEIDQLKKRCHILESMRSSASDQYNVEDCDTSGESVLIVGGFDGNSWLSDLSSYSPLEDNVVSLCPMTFPRLSASVAKLNGELYIFGGVYDGVWYDTVESYKPMIDQWIPRPSLSKKKGSMAGASLYETIFAMGGGNGVECLSEVELLDLNIGNWISTQSMLEKRMGAAAAYMNGALYVAGGFDGKEYLRSVERFDPRQHGWSRVASMNSKRGSHSLVAFKEEIYALGGYDGDSVVSTVEVFDPRIGSWIIEEPMAVSRLNFVSFVFGGKIYVIGGMKDGENLDVIECYESGSGWQVTGNTNLGKRSFFNALVT